MEITGAAPVGTYKMYKATLFFGASLFDKHDADPSDDWEQWIAKFTVRLRAILIKR